MRVIWIILDSVGIGALPDAEQFGDAGANTIGHIAEAYPGIALPNLRRLGLGNITGVENIPPVFHPAAMYGRAAELSRGKDTITGHWEMTGILTKEPFQVYPEGFPREVIQRFVEETGCGSVLGNKVASGTEILKELGDRQEQTGYPIVYTSADSVFQIAASEETTGLDRLYQMCEAARRIMTGDHNVARVIARPFVRRNGEFVRTANRRDYAIRPNTENLLAYLMEAGIPVTAVGKIHDIFSGCGIQKSIHTENNMDGVDKTLQEMEVLSHGLIFTNLVEFDSQWGHRRNVQGYKEGLEAFDRRLPEIISAMKQEDVLIINADHGCDPSFHGTDHTREYIPVLVYGEQMEAGKNIGTRESFADIGASIGRLFGVRKLPLGRSFLG
jgi:phosphopentomutase